jgi:hypothetical protein
MVGTKEAASADEGTMEKGSKREDNMEEENTGRANQPKHRQQTTVLERSRPCGLESASIQL